MQQAHPFPCRTADGVRLALCGERRRAAARDVGELAHTSRASVAQPLPGGRGFDIFTRRSPSVLRHDSRGCSLSDRDAGNLSYETWGPRSPNARPRAAGFRRFAMSGAPAGRGAIAIDYAARHLRAGQPSGACTGPTHVAELRQTNSPETEIAKACRCWRTSRGSAVARKTTTSCRSGLALPAGRGTQLDIISSLLVRADARRHLRRDCRSGCCQITADARRRARSRAQDQMSGSDRAPRTRRGFPRSNVLSAACSRASFPIAASFSSTVRTTCRSQTSRPGRAKLLRGGARLSRRKPGYTAPRRERPAAFEEPHAAARTQRAGRQRQRLSRQRGRSADRSAIVGKDGPQSHYQDIRQDSGQAPLSGDRAGPRSGARRGQQQRPSPATRDICPSRAGGSDRAYAAGGGGLNTNPRLLAAGYRQGVHPVKRPHASRAERRQHPPEADLLQMQIVRRHRRRAATPATWPGRSRAIRKGYANVCRSLPRAANTVALAVVRNGVTGLRKRHCTDWDERAVEARDPHGGSQRAPRRMWPCGCWRSFTSRCSTRSIRSNGATRRISCNCRRLRQPRRTPPRRRPPPPCWRASMRKTAEMKRALASYLTSIPDGPAKSDGIKLGEAVATKVLQARAGDGFDAPDAYRPRTTPGVYVPTAITPFVDVAGHEAVRHGQGLAIPARPAAAAHERRVGNRLQRNQGLRRGRTAPSEPLQQTEARPVLDCPNTADRPAISALRAPSSSPQSYMSVVGQRTFRLTTLMILAGLNDAVGSSTCGAGREVSLPISGGRSRRSATATSMATRRPSGRRTWQCRSARRRCASGVSACSHCIQSAAVAGRCRPGRYARGGPMDIPEIALTNPFLPGVTTSFHATSRP